jgi:nicotinate phosphoribosyltransferase
VRHVAVRITFGSPIADLICLEEERIVAGASYTFHHPLGDYRSFTLGDYAEATPLLGLRMKDGAPAGPQQDMPALQARARAQLDLLDDTYKRLINPHVYKVSLSDGLNELKSHLIQESLSRGAQK